MPPSLLLTTPSTDPKEAIVLVELGLLEQMN
jgi:hypothetical protein